MRIASQVQSISFTVVLVAVLTSTVFAGVVLTAALAGIPFAYFARDPSVTTGAAFYVGFLSHLNVLLWASTASICLFSAIASRPDGFHDNSPFLLWAGLLTAVLMLDDLLQFHEEVFPVHLGIPELMVYAAYGGSLLLLLTAFQTVILRTDYLLLGMSLALLGFSMGIDKAPFPVPRQMMVEDGAKLMGIAFWLAYFSRVAAGVRQPAGLARGQRKRSGAVR